MSCTVCGSSVACGCTVRTGQLVDPWCTQGQENCCNTAVKTSPQPFYSCAPGVQQSNIQQIIVQQFNASLKVANSWNVPACGMSATLTISGLVDITIGSYIWDAAFGYFEVTAFDANTEQITVINHCNDDNAAAGTAVPSCTIFVNTAPPATDPSSNTPCVAIDFTAPAVSDCIDITLTTTTGISAGDIIQIGSGFYRVSTIKPDNIITICNDGDGITPGTSVIAKDASDNYQYCIEIISVSPCVRDAELEGSLVICNGDGLQTRLTVPNQGWIPVGISEPFNQVEMKPLGYDPFCTTLVTALNISSGNAGPYSLTVTDSSGFSIGDILEIAGYVNTLSSNTARLTVTGVADATHVAGTIDPVPGANVTVPAGTSVCQIGCCEVTTETFAARTFVYNDIGVALGTGTINAGSPLLTSSLQAFPVSNPSTTSSMVIFGTLVASITLLPNMVVDTNALAVIFNLDTNVDAGVYGLLAVADHLYASVGGASFTQAEQVVGASRPIVTLLPGTSATIHARLRIIRDPTSDAGTAANITEMYIQGYYHGQLI